MRSDRDLDQSRSRFIRAVTHILNGLRLCRDRILEEQASAPRLLQGTPEEVIDLTNAPANDLDYYTYELGRLHHVAVAVLKIFDQPRDVLDAVAAFDAASHLGWSDAVDSRIAFPITRGANTTHSNLTALSMALRTRRIQRPRRNTVQDFTERARHGAMRKRPMR